MRNIEGNDFFVEVPGIGTFRFGRRTYKDRQLIRAEFLRRVKELGETDQDLSTMAQISAEYGVLCVEAPAGWEDLDALSDIEIPNLEDKVFEVYLALKEKEGSFRKGANTASQGAGAGVEPNAGILVPPAVQPAADGSALPVADAGAD